MPASAQIKLAHGRIPQQQQKKINRKSLKYLNLNLKLKDTMKASFCCCHTLLYTTALSKLFFIYFEFTPVFL